MFLVRSVCLSVCLSACLSVCPSDYSQTCERILTTFFVGVGHGSRTKWYNFGGDPDHASDPGVQSPKSGSSVLLTNCVMLCSVEVCALWAYSRWKYSSLQQLAWLLQELTCPMGSHSVTCHPAKVILLPLFKSIKAGTLFSDPKGMQGWVDIVGLVTYRGSKPTCRQLPIAILTGLNVE